MDDILQKSSKSESPSLYISLIHIFKYTSNFLSAHTYINIHCILTINANFTSNCHFIPHNLKHFSQNTTKNAMSFTVIFSLEQ